MDDSQGISPVPALRIGEVAELTGLSPSTIRWYEKLGLILAQRESSGYRTFTPDDVAWLRALQAYFETTQNSPRCLATLLAWLPLQELRTQVLGEICPVQADGAACWSRSATPTCTRMCRACPAYAAKALALDFEKNFVARRR